MSRAWRLAGDSGSRGGPICRSQGGQRSSPRHRSLLIRPASSTDRTWLLSWHPWACLHATPELHRNTESGGDRRSLLLARCRPRPTPPLPTGPLSSGDGRSAFVPVGRRGQKVGSAMTRPPRLAGPESPLQRWAVCNQTLAGPSGPGTPATRQSAKRRGPPGTLEQGHRSIFKRPYG